MKMPKEMKEKWLAALRSGEYKQSKGSLKTAKGYCCLGVLEMVCDGDVEYQNSSKDGALGVPTVEWVKNHGLEKSYYTDRFMAELVQMNDGTESCIPHDFLQIADFIEQNVEAAE